MLDIDPLQAYEDQYEQDFENIPQNISGDILEDLDDIDNSPIHFAQKEIKPVNFGARMKGLNLADIKTKDFHEEFMDN